MVPDGEPDGEEDGDRDGISEQPPPRRHQQWQRIGYEEQEHNLEGHSSRSFFWWAPNTQSLRQVNE
jgi:hypothetical protein